MKSPVEKIIIGSRGSQLALWQSEWIKARLEKHFSNLNVIVEIIKTTGDKILDSPLSKIGDKGLFTKEIEHALLEKRIDLAVHSLKDVPTELPAGLTIGAITRREDVRDVFIAHPKKAIKTFDGIPQNGTIATGSLRRKSQLLHLRPDLQIVDLRGNLNTRFTKLEHSDWDGIILARAGVIRLGFENRITEIIPIEKMLPAVGQGALAVEIRAGEPKLNTLLQPLISRSTTIAVNAERAFLHFLEGGCQVPVGTYGRIENNIFFMDALIGNLDGSTIVRGRIQGSPDAAESLARQLAETLYNSGGKKILDVIRTPASDLLSIIA
jgi:hydroxymethylbilane synthase